MTKKEPKEQSEYYVSYTSPDGEINSLTVRAYTAYQAASFFAKFVLKNPSLRGQVNVLKKAENVTKSNKKKDFFKKETTKKDSLADKLLKILKKEQKAKNNLCPVCGYQDPNFSQGIECPNCR